MTQNDPKSKMQRIISAIKAKLFYRVNGGVWVSLEGSSRGHRVPRGALEGPVGPQNDLKSKMIRIILIRKAKLFYLVHGGIWLSLGAHGDPVDTGGGLGVLGGATMTQNLKFSESFR